MNFNITYSTGILAGKFGWEDITIANVTVKDAQVAVVDQAYFQFDVSGLFGLAFSSLTNEYPGSDPTKDVKTHYMNYEPVFYKMVDQHLSLPTFSFAPDRDGPNGYFSVGGIPPVNTTGKTASASILTVSYHSSKEREDVSLANHEISLHSRARIPIQSLPSTDPTTTTSTSMVLSLEEPTPHSAPLSASWILLPLSLCSPAVSPDTQMPVCSYLIFSASNSYCHVHCALLQTTRYHRRVHPTLSSSMQRHCAQTRHHY